MNPLLFSLIVISYAAISAYGLYLIKAAPTLTSMQALVGGLFYGGGFCMWIAILRAFPLSIAFPVAAGSLIIATHLVARMRLAETFLVSQTLGVGLIIVGIFLVFTRAQ